MIHGGSEGGETGDMGGTKANAYKPAMKNSSFNLDAWF